MDVFIPDKLMDILVISLTFSIFLMALIQKIKTFEFIKKTYQVFLINFIFSFLIGIPFGIEFFDLNIYESIWISLFCFIGAPTIYEVLKNQNMINYTPKELNKDYYYIPIKNEIPRNKT